jgi:hypothetical protein
MMAQKSDSLLRDGLYPNGLTHVLVLAKAKHSDTYKWTSGMATGETDQYDEHFEVRTDSPLVEPDVSMYHKEDIKNPDSHTVSELNS